MSLNVTEERIEELVEVLDNLSTDDLVNIHNEHYSADDEIFSMDMFDEMCNGMTPTDIAQRIFFGDFNPNHNYFKFDGYANFESTGFPKDWIYIRELAEYMIDNENDYYCDEVIELFDKWYEEDDIEED